MLEAIADLERAHRGAGSDELVEALGWDREQLGAAMRRLETGGYVYYNDVSDFEGWDALDIRLDGSARRIIGQWPNEDVAYEELLQLLADRAGEERDPDRRQALERARAFLEAAGASAVGGVLHSLWRVLAGL